MIVITSVEVNRRKRRREVEETIRKEFRIVINRLVKRVGLIIIGDNYLRIVINDNKRILLEEKER